MVSAPLLLAPSAPLVARSRALRIGAWLLLLSGCAGQPPIPLDDVDLSLTPEIAVRSFADVRGHRVAWGGTIVSSTNLAEHTRIEVLGFPLDRHSARPDIESTAGTRFLIHRPGYLETSDFAPGRQVSVAGPLEALEQGKVGEADYTYPVVGAEQLHLWPRGGGAERRTFFHFGIILSN